LPVGIVDAGRAVRTSVRTITICGGIRSIRIGTQSSQIRSVLCDDPWSLRGVGILGTGGRIRTAILPIWIIHAVGRIGASILSVRITSGVRCVGVGAKLSKVFLGVERANESEEELDREVFHSSRLATHQDTKSPMP
jgi:hypothetical protein